MNSTTKNPRTCQDYELVQQAIEGDQQAYGALLSRYQNSVFHHMYNMVKNREDANDLTIEAFGKAFHNLTTYTPSFAFSTWLFRIAINNCIDFVRRKRLETHSIDDTIESESDTRFSDYLRAERLDPEERYIRQQKLDLVRKAVRKLNHQYQLMIELRYFEERSYDEIARELDIPLGTVKAQLFRAKKKLSHTLQLPGARAYHDYRVAS